MKIVFFVLVALMGIAFAYRLNPIPTSAKPTTAQRLPQNNALSPRNTETRVDNPDGTRTLTMNTQKLSGTTTAYTFFVVEGNDKQPIFRQTVDTTTTFSIPANTFSPGDNTYVFLKEQSSQGKRYLVLKSSGQPFTEDQQYLDVNALFAKTPNKYQIKDVTGWDSPELLHVQTQTEQGAKGPSFWFEVSSRVFLQLAS